MIVVALLTMLALSAPAQTEFQAIPEALTESYCFDLVLNFYESEEQARQELDELVKGIAELEALKGRITESGSTLHEALLKYETILPKWYKIWVYAYLRYAINTDDMELMQEVRMQSGDVNSRLQFVQNEIELLSDERVVELMTEEQNLKPLQFAIEDIRRYKPHRLSLEQEELLARLEPMLRPWFREMYQKLVDHTEFDSIQVDTGERLDTRLDYGRLIRDQSRDIREKAFHNYFYSYGQHRDLYAYVLLKELKTYDTIAQIRHYSGRQEERFFDLYLEPNHVRNVYSQIEARGDLVKRYQDLRMARVSQLMGIEDVKAWDLSVIPENFQRPRYDIMEATDIIEKALGILGDEYGELLVALLDPDQGRIDIVAGPKRVPGAFSYGYYGHPRLFFSQKYEGYISDLSTLAHESGHAVHYQLMEEAGARLLYAHGPTYVTESVAMLNELLLKDYLWEMNKEADIDTRVFFLEKLVGETTAFFWTAEIATLESALYDSADAGLLHTADDLDSLTLSISRRFSAFTNKHPNEYRRFWSMVEHYYEQPMYNVNYVMAAVLALRFYQEMKHDPVFVSSYLRLLKHPFDRPAPEILRLIVGANLRDPELLESAFDFVNEKLDELEKLYREAGVKIE